MAKKKSAVTYKTVRASPGALGLIMDDDASAVSDLLIDMSRERKTVLAEAELNLQQEEQGANSNDA